MTGTGTNQSSSVTATVNVLTAWELILPIQCQMSNVSADPVVNIYPSPDGGNTYDTTIWSSFLIARISGGGLGQASVRLPRGLYAIQMISSGSSSQTFKILTAEMVTAIINV